MHYVGPNGNTYRVRRAGRSERTASKVESCAEGALGLKVVGKPAKAVEAQAVFEMGKLVLVPITSRIHVGAGAAPHGAVGLGIFLRNTEGEPIRMSLAPSTSATCMAAFWFVSTSQDAEECNMKLSLDASGNDLSDKALSSVQNVKIPLMVNTDRIEPGTRLVVILLF